MDLWIENAENGSLLQNPQPIEHRIDAGSIYYYDSELLTDQLITELDLKEQHILYK